MRTFSTLGPLPPNFDAALRDVHAKGGEYREAAARVLGDPPPGRETEAREGLITLLSDIYGPIRALAADGLGDVGDELDLELLLACTEDEHADARASSIIAAAKIDPSDALWLEGKLEDEHPRVRIAALDALETKRAPAAIIASRQFLEADPSESVRIAAAVLVGSIDDLGAARTETVQALKDVLHSGTDLARSAALSLARLGDASGEAQLIEALHDGPWRLAAIDGLGLFSSAASANALAELGERVFASLIDRAAAAAALAKRGDARAVPILRRVLSAWRADGRDYALFTIAEHGMSELLPDLLPFVGRLRGASPTALARALRAIDDPQAQDAVRQLEMKHPKQADS
ncbi:MAG: HEAT repeat protein [Polyangiales bacterium]|jgi:HEAT repeat protein